MLNAKCVTFSKFGNPRDVLKLENRQIEPPKEHEVLVRMIARPINPSDLIPIRGSYAHRITLPNIPGYEGVGVVEDVGRLVSKDVIGKRVLPLRGEGTWQDYVKTSANFAVPVPNGIDDATAAQLYINPVTAWVTCTEILRLTPNDVLIINAGGSAIGHVYAQLAKLLGFRLIAVTRNEHYTKGLLSMGASYVINTSNAPLYDTVMELTKGAGTYAAIDSVGGIAGEALASCVQPNGKFLSIGLLSGQQLNWADLINKGKLDATIFHLRNWNHAVSLSKWHDVFHHLFALVDHNKLRVMDVQAKFELTEFISAIDAVEAAEGVKGKVLLMSV